MDRDKKIGIIGGKGDMGSFFKSFFRRKGFEVFISDIGSKLTNREVAKRSDIVFLSLPLDVVFEVIEEIGDVLDENKLLSDFSSLKEDVVKSMLKNSKSSVIGMHPMFGPFTKNLEGQNIILSVGRDRDNWERRISNIFENDGLNINKMDAQSHDKHMAFVQGLTHTIAIVLGRVMQKKNMHPLDSSNFSTPIFRLNSDLIGRLFAQDLSLYSSIIGCNRYTKESINAFLESFEEVRQEILEKDTKDSALFLKDIKLFFNDSFCKKAFERSSNLLDTFFNDSIKNSQ